MTTLRIFEDITGGLGPLDHWLHEGDWRLSPGQLWWGVERPDIEPGERFLLLEEDESGNSALIASGTVIEALATWRAPAPLPACYGQDPWGQWELGPQATLWAIAIEIDARLTLPISMLYQRYQLSPSFWSLAQGDVALDDSDAALLLKIWDEHLRARED